MLQTFAEKVRRYIQNRRGIGTWHFHDVSEHVSQSVLPIEALEHAERACNLNFLNQQQTLRFGRRLKIRSASQVLGKALKAQLQLLHWAFFTSRI